MLTLTLTSIVAVSLALTPPPKDDASKITSLYGLVTEQGTMFCRPGGSG
ncbi:MAG: hypothetical protein ACI9OJ_002269, partial [Myxococcota bacterium]